MADNLLYSAMIAFGVTGLGIDSLHQVMPPPQTADFFEVQGISADRAGNGAELHVKRTIRAPIDMAYTVRIMAEDGAQWRQWCKAEGAVIQYRPEAVLPDPVSLDWWTDGKCPVLPPGPAQIITTWKPAAKGLDPVTAIARVE